MSFLKKTGESHWKSFTLSKNNMNLVLAKLKESRSSSAFKLSKIWSLNAIVAGFERTIDE